MKEIKRKLTFAELTIESYRIGDEYCIHVSGGDKPHIGCAVLAIPRPSLRDKNMLSATSSVMNVAGHQDEHICRLIAEAAAKKKNAVTVCTGGFHVDHITEEQIRELMDCVKELVEELECLI